MALTADQQAMLQLLLERGQSYEDLAGVLGVGVDEVRSRARAALRELGGADPDPEVGLTDYLLGEADPIGRADAVRHLQSDPEARRLASELVDRLREVAPAAELPQLPKPRERRRLRRRQPVATEAAPTPGGSGDAGAAAEAARRPSAPARLRDTLSRRQQQTIVVLIASAVLVIAGVLAITGAFGGEDSESATVTQPTTAAQDDVLTEVPLEPQGGGEASGEATFGLATGDQPYVELSLSGLSASQEGSAYVVWLLLTEDQGYPLSPLQPGPDGTFSERFPIPQFAIPIAGRARFVDISLSQNESLLKDLRKAVQDQRPILRYQGESLLRGEIPAAAQGGGGAQGGGAAPGG
jgi:hypothetical protein